LARAPFVFSANWMLADILVLSQDLFNIDPMKIFQTKVVITVFDGKIVFERR
jgi:predicted amidohydrolase YtcJ